MKEIQINFVDFWSGFVPEECFIYRLLSQRYQVVISERPDYLFYSCGGYRHLDYPDAVRIFYTGENVVPDFNVCDYAIGFHHLRFEDRYVRFPLYLVYRITPEELERLEKPKVVSPELANRKFCNFVYSNGKQADPMRESFFRLLSEYKRVDSGGRYLNNIGGPVTDKLEFLSQYKFTIAFENCALSGYTTEKILDPMRALSMPIYYGDPNVDRDFNPGAIIRIKDRTSLERAVEEIVRLDRDDEAYLEKLRRPWFAQTGITKSYESKLENFLSHIIEQPFEKAFRTTDYAWAGYYKQCLRRAMPLNGNPLFRKVWGIADRWKRLSAGGRKKED